MLAKSGLLLAVNMKRKEKDGVDMTTDVIIRSNHAHAIYVNFNPGPDYGNHRTLMIGPNCSYKEAPSVLPGDWNGNKEYSFVGIIVPST